MKILNKLKPIKINQIIIKQHLCTSNFKPLKFITNKNKNQLSNQTQTQSQQVSSNIKFKSYKPQSSHNTDEAFEETSTKMIDQSNDLDIVDDSIDIIKDKRKTIGGEFFQKINNFSYIQLMLNSILKKMKHIFHISNFPIKDIIPTLIYNKLYRKDYFNRKVKILFVVDDIDLYETLLLTLKHTNSSFGIYNENNKNHAYDAIICTSNQYEFSFDLINSRCDEYPIILFHNLDESANAKLIKMVEASDIKAIIINNNYNTFYDKYNIHCKLNYNEFSKEDHLKMFSCDMVSIIIIYIIHLFISISIPIPIYTLLLYIHLNIWIFHINLYIHLDCISITNKHNKELIKHNPKKNR